MNTKYKITIGNALFIGFIIEFVSHEIRVWKFPYLVCGWVDVFSERFFPSYSLYLSLARENLLEWKEKIKNNRKKSSNAQHSFSKYLWHLKFYKYAIYVLIHDSPIYFFTLRHSIQVIVQFIQKFLFISWQGNATCRFFSSYSIHFIWFGLSLCLSTYVFFFAIWQTKRNEEKIKSKRSTWTEREGGVKWRRKTNICSSSCI